MDQCSLQNLFNQVDDSVVDSLESKANRNWIDDDLVMLEAEKLKQKQAQIEHEVTPLV